MSIWIIRIAGLYFAGGFVFAIYFLIAGVTRLDRAAIGSSIWFRLLLIPGAVALWPLLALRLMSNVKAPTEHNAHRDAVEEGRR